MHDLPFLHDPKGKTRTPVQGVRASADVSPCGRWRRRLERDWTEDGQQPKTLLWIGMNPSTADALVDDPTCARERGFTQRWGYTRYLKGNVLDWRATFPTDIPLDPALASTSANIVAILDMLDQSEAVVAAWGKLPPRLAPLSARVHHLLHTSGKPVLCLGRNLDGSPKHPLYLRKDTAPEPY